MQLPTQFYLCIRRVGELLPALPMSQRSSMSNWYFVLNRTASRVRPKDRLIPKSSPSPHTQNETPYSFQGASGACTSSLAVESQIIDALNKEYGSAAAPQRDRQRPHRTGQRTRGSSAIDQSLGSSRALTSGSILPSTDTPRTLVPDHRGSADARDPDRLQQFGTAQSVKCV
jgi:hypothetical protein